MSISIRNEINDKEVIAALQFIRDNSLSLLQVDDVVQFVNTSRRFLERRFKKSLGCSIQQIIKKMHIKQMEHMLIKTNMPVKRIAFALGHSTDNISRYFKQETGVSPVEYRRRNQKVRTVSKR